LLPLISTGAGEGMRTAQRTPFVCAAVVGICDVVTRHYEVVVFNGPPSAGHERARPCSIMFIQPAL
jgi:hypothetical protein